MKISVIVPAYEVELYLDKCLHSLLNQTHKNLDLVIVDDGSSDKSFEIAAKWVAKDPRVFLVTKPGGGPSSARNLGLELIQGTGLRSLLELEDLDSLKAAAKNMGGGGGGCGLGTHKACTPSQSPNPCISPHLTSLKRNSFDQTKTKLSPLAIAKHFTKLEDRIYKCDLVHIDDLITQELPNDRWIHFMDSDDYLKLDCLQNTIEALHTAKVPKGIEIEIVARDAFDFYYEERKAFENCRYIRTRGDFYPQAFQCLVDNDLYDFAFVCQGIFKAAILNRYGLRFTNGIFHEDNDFGTLLFSLARASIHPNIDGFVYRKRRGSITTSYGQDAFPKNMPPYLEPLRPHFDSYTSLRDYFHAYCRCVLAYQLHNFVKQHPSIDKNLKKILQKGQRHYIHKYVYGFSHLNHLDPQGLLADMGINNLEAYRKSDTRKAKWEARYQNLRFCWRHPLRALKRLANFNAAKPQSKPRG